MRASSITNQYEFWLDASNALVGETQEDEAQDEDGVLGGFEVGVGA